ncbi:pyridine nucleotide-disulfide oxidoreductase, partial [bacterium]
YMRTSMKDVFAVGDCTAKRHFLTGEYTKLMLASTAMAQGRLAGSNLFEIKVIKEFPGALGTFSTRICDVAFASVGLTESDAKRAGIDYVVGTNEAVDRHPGKLPDASRIYIKLIFARYSHQLLGAQIKGGVSAGEMINMLSVMIQNRMTDMEIDTLQIGTHPLLTSSPIAYPVINATVSAIMKWYKK